VREFSMSTVQVVEEIRRLTTAEQLEVIEATTRLIRKDLGTRERPEESELDQSMRQAALVLKDLYEPGQEHVEWTALDGEEILDDTESR
jgi:hypothetical protein